MMQIVFLHDYQTPLFYKTKRKKSIFFRKSMRSGTACAMIISGAHIIPKIQREYEFVISQNQFSDITNSLLFSDITKSN